MKASLLLVLMIGLFLSCSRTIDDTNQNCTSNCTIIRGRIFTRDNKPVSNVNVALSYKKNTVTYSYVKRKIKNVRSDQNGYYEIDFYMNDGEVGAAGNGYFTIDIDKNSFDSNHYLIPGNPLFAISSQIYSISKRDTTITKDYYMPTKSSLKIHLKDFKPIKPEDAFQVKVLYPYGWRTNVINDYLGGYFETGIAGEIGEYSATSNDYTTTIGVASNDTCVIRIAKIKNGISFPEETRIFILDNSLLEFTYHY